jgi:hypothetical protein
VVVPAALENIRLLLRLLHGFTIARDRDVKARDGVVRRTMVATTTQRQFQTLKECPTNNILVYLNNNTNNSNNKTNARGTVGLSVESLNKETTRDNQAQIVVCGAD